MKRNIRKQALRILVLSSLFALLMPSLISTAIAQVYYTGNIKYFGPYPNFATSQLATIDPVTGDVIDGIQKFVDSLPGLTPAGVNNLLNYIPVADPDTTTYPGSDYYEIAVVEFEQQMHSDLAPTRLRGYVQISTEVVLGLHVALTNLDGSPINFGNGTRAYGVDRPLYLGPLIVAQKDVPVRVKFYNLLPTGVAGNLFLPVDKSVMGADMGPILGQAYSENRATLHLHGGRTPWISDGTPHQWITPANEVTEYPEGVSVYDVPDMTTPEDGSMTFYYTNQQSARLMFYHDHAYGITRLNVYAGEAAGYILRDEMEDSLIAANLIPGPANEIPLIIQDKTFVPSLDQLAWQDPTWTDYPNWGQTAGSLWYPHVYMTMQNPGDPSGMNQFGRWHYGPWFWPPTVVPNGPVLNPNYEPGNPMEPQWLPGVPDVSAPAEAFMDTPILNGVAYPYLNVDPTAYRFRVLNAADDRSFNLQMYIATEGIVSGFTITNPGSGYAVAPTVTITGGGHGATATATIDPATGAVTAINIATVGSAYTAIPTVTLSASPTGNTATATAKIYTAPTEVGMVPAVFNAAYPETWPVDGREGGVPDPAYVGPSFIQIGNDGGFLPAPWEIPTAPVNWNMDQGTFDFGLVNQYTLFLGPAERADVIVDFSAFAGNTIILYNDSPAPVPAADPRVDYFTGCLDKTEEGGAPSTPAGYGPNIRTLMQINVAKADVTPATYDVAALETAFAYSGLGVFANSQHTIIVPQTAYSRAYGAALPDIYSNIFDSSLTFTPIGGTVPVTINFQAKTIQDEMGEAFNLEDGRMAVLLGVELPKTRALMQTMILYNFPDPPTEVIQVTGDITATPIGGMADGTQIWKITHNGVDTHPVHWHMFEVQLLNRVAWDNNIRMPDPNEIGWKETIRVNPLQDTIVALRPIQIDLPWDLPNSVRLLDPTQPDGTLLKVEPNIFDTIGEPINLYNHMVNFGIEHVWHCHILAHEEMDMMRPMVVAAPPRAPTTLAVSKQGNRATLTWNDNSLSETNFVIERANSPGFTVGLVTFTVGANISTYLDQPIQNNQAYYYRVKAINVVGDTWDYTDPNINNGAVGFPSLKAESAYTNTVLLGTAQPPAAPTNLIATSIVTPASTTVSLAWNDNSDDENGFLLQRATNNGFSQNLVQIPLLPNVNTYDDTTLLANTGYFYRIRAFNAVGNSAWSNTLRIR